MFEDHGNWLEAGLPAHLVVFDPAGTTDVVRPQSKSRNAPYIGRQWKGAVRYTMYAGVLTHEESGVKA